MKQEAQTTVKWFRRYTSLLTLGVVAVFIYMIFFSETSVVKKLEYQATIDSLQVELANVQDSVAYYKDLNSRLINDREIMEQIVREHHNMKRPDEDVYLVTNE